MTESKLALGIALLAHMAAAIYCLSVPNQFGGGIGWFVAIVWMALTFQWRSRVQADQRMRERRERLAGELHDELMRGGGPARRAATPCFVQTMGESATASPP